MFRCAEESRKPVAYTETSRMSLAWTDTQFSSLTGPLGHRAKGASWMVLVWRQAGPTLPPVVVPSKTADLVAGGGRGEAEN